MSMMTSVLSLAYTLILLLLSRVSAGTMTALALVLPSEELRVETKGGSPGEVGQTVNHCKAPLGTTVTFSEYACTSALEGIGSAGQAPGLVALLVLVLLRRAKFLVWFAPNNGPPYGPFGQRVSTTRHGCTGTK